MAVIRDEATLINHVCETYWEEESELNGLFFDFDVEMPKREILSAYKEIQRIINGDCVCRYENGEEAEEFIPEGEMQEIYSGNCKEFLESFNGQDVYRRYYGYYYTDKEDALEYDASNFLF